MLTAQFALAATINKAVLAVRGVEFECIVVDRLDYSPADRGADRELTRHELACDDWPSFVAVTDRDDQLPRTVTATFDPTGVASPSVGEVGALQIALASLALAGLITASLLLRAFAVYRGRRRGAR